MVLQTTGKISLSNIQTEFGGTTPLNMSNYYAGGANVPLLISGVPTSGQINLNTFYGKQKGLTSATSNNTYYTDLTRYNSVFTIVQSGTDPDVQLQFASSNAGGAVTQAYASTSLQNNAYVVINFEIYIASNSAADAVWFFMGLNSAPTNTFFEFTSSTAYKLVFEVYNNGTYARGLHLIKNGSSTAVASYATTSHIASTWIPVQIIYSKSATNTFSISFNNTNVITYSDASYASYVSGAGAYWGFGARTGGSTGDFYIRRVNVSYRP